MKILYLHGWQSVPGGVKPTYLALQGHELLEPALPDEDFAAAVRIAEDWHQRHTPDVLVGSSRGGAVALNMHSGATPLVLLCPAWKRWGTRTAVKLATLILHSPRDNVVPYADSLELLRNSGLPETALVPTGSEHRLADPDSLQKLAAVVAGLHP
jgi:alpha-beta hydrolase superfamily lysophospholipase